MVGCHLSNPGRVGPDPSPHGHHRFSLACNSTADSDVDDLPRGHSFSDSRLRCSNCTYLVTEHRSLATSLNALRRPNQKLVQLSGEVTRRRHEKKRSRARSRLLQSFALPIAAAAAVLFLLRL